jgi:hypothetical protein
MPQSQVTAQAPIRQQNLQSKIDDVQHVKQVEHVLTQNQTSHHQSDVEKTILDKIELANRRLKFETDVEKITELCNMIKSAAEALNALKICFKND